MDNLLKTLFKIFDYLDDNKIMQAIKHGLVLAIPFLMIGSIALILLSLPIEPYMNFIENLLSGSINDIIAAIKECTFSFIALIMVITISYSYGESSNMDLLKRIIMVVVSTCSFIIFSGSAFNNTGLYIFQAPCLFTGIFVSILSSMLFVKFSSMKTFNSFSHIYGSDSYFNSAVSAIVPSAIVLLIFSVASILIVHLFGVSSFQDLFSNFILSLFSGMGRNLKSAIMFIFSMQLMWFLGIHGSNVLDSVAQQLFASALDININLVSMGSAPSEIFTKTFFDVFVLMGGCGTILCLLIAIFVNSKKSNLKEFAKMSIGPVLFNINELVIFGLPVVFNPTLLIPFIFTPVVLTLISYGALYMGLVPYTTSTVQWTTPVFLSGYVATGSIRGSILQLINLCIGTLIYIPFIRISEKHQMVNFKKGINKMIDIVKESESLGVEPVLINRSDNIGSIAKTLVTDLDYAIKHNDIELFYQPQVNFHGSIIGAEALLRWKHNIGGYLYPPLVIALAKEGLVLDDLGILIIKKACISLEQLENLFHSPMKISVNISADQLNNPNFNDAIEELLSTYKITPSNLGIELTEQISLSSSPVINQRLREIRDLGIKLLMDDFGMGHSSMMYLKNSNFDIVKLDGSLVKDILLNERCVDIISSIVELSSSLGFTVLAEYVETENQRNKLHEVGCNLYQGYLYSPPLPFNEFLHYINSSNTYKEVKKN